VMNSYGPVIAAGALLIACGFQLMAIGLLGELQVRHYFTSQAPSRYHVERTVRLAPVAEK
jgi:hypothetical protein